MAGSKGGKKKRRGKKGRGDENHRLLAAARHPLRRKILWLMSDERKASPCELAKALDEPLGSVSYHVRVLVKCRALRRVSKRKVRGATEHFYRRAEMPAWIREILEEDEGQTS